jgi:hypothetical protein
MDVDVKKVLSDLVRSAFIPSPIGVVHPGSFVLPSPWWRILSEHQSSFVGLEEEKRVLVIALPLWDPQRRRSILCGCELRIKSLCLFCLLEFFVSL